MTTVVDHLPKNFLTFWAAKTAAEAAVTHWDIVSELIKRDPAGAVDYLKNAHRRESKAAADLGSAAHDLFERLCRGETINPRHVHVDVKKHVKHFSEFLQVTQPTFLHLEEAVWSDTHGYAGSFDAIATIDGETVLLDWKTSKSVYDSVALQLSAYRYADRIILAESGESVPVPEITGGAVVHVRPEGWKLVPVECGPAVFDVFKALRQVFDWERTGKRGVVGRPVAHGGDLETGTQRRAA
ncbi:hypothetical protein AB0I84_41660 [Streptomyces spectabilis]|uniref:hypothetical protein n=1 Tax=Streptomyces spectabilis TaxID=68270 RepID=UPI0033E265C7